jgi:nicotinate-nucleotide adenylyltransferase
MLEAIRYHTFGHAGMGDLAKILYIADKIEPGRTHIPAGYMEMHDDDTLDEFIISVLQEGMTYLQNQGYNISAQTEQFLYSLVHNGENKA